MSLPDRAPSAAKVDHAEEPLFNSRSKIRKRHRQGDKVRKGKKRHPYKQACVSGSRIRASHQPAAPASTMASNTPTPQAAPHVQAGLEAAAAKVAEDLVKDARKFPKSSNYNWLPLMTALCLYNGEVPADPDDLPRAESYDLPDTTPGHGSEWHDRAPVNTPDYGGMRQSRAPPQKPGSSNRDYVWYVPTWTHPRHSDRYVAIIQGQRKLRRTTDPTNLLRPALLPQDALRHPTDYAKRFGIFPGEIGGRSHLSPTLATTRDPLADYTTQLDMLSDVEKEHLINETRNKGLGSATDPNHINPSVMEDYFKSNGIVTGQLLRDGLAGTLPHGNFEQTIEHFRKISPQTVAANSSFIDGVLRDQDWQRFLFQDMTTDELIRENVHTMSNAEPYELKGKLHPLNGERKEWDAYRNDDVWEALQPALQLVTRILNSEHPHYRDLMDVNTRQLLDEEHDPRYEPGYTRNITTVNLTKMVKRANIDEDNTHDEIIALRKMGYDWEENVKRLMNRTLMFEIGACHFCALSGEYSDDLIYGYNYRYEEKSPRRSCNILSLAAEMIWPLLIPETSQSEKLTASFLIAVVILHELSHAIVNCLQWLTQDRAKQPPEQSQEITKQLMRLGDELWEPELFISEHPYEDCPEAEHGSQLEMEMFGWNMQTFIGGPVVISRDADLDTLLLKGIAWPMAGGSHHDRLLNPVGVSPPDDYGIATPIDYMAKFFTEEFWSSDFARYGHEAFKQLSYKRVQKFLMRSDWSFSVDTLAYFGTADGRFLRTLATQLNSFGHPILGLYIRDLYNHATRRNTVPAKWLLTLDRMGKIIDIDPLIKQNRIDSTTGGDLNKLRLSSDTSLFRRYGDFCERHAKAVIDGKASGVPDSFETWKSHLEAIWRDMFREGGKLMKQLAQLHGKMQMDIAVLQRIVLEFFSLEHDIQDSLYIGGGPTCPSTMGTVCGRIEGLMEAANQISQTALGFSWVSELAHVQEPWEQWSARFRANAQMYSDLRIMLTADPENPTRVRTHDPSDVVWKAKLKTIPSSHWKKRSDRIALLAAHQYTQVDQRIRDALDHASEIINRVVGTTAFPGIPNTEDINKQIASMQLENQKRMEDNDTSRKENDLFRIPAAVAQHQAGLSGAQGTSSSNDSMDVVYDQIIQDSSAGGTGAAMPSAMVGIQFGQPSQSRAARTRVRTPPPARRRSASPRRSSARQGTRQTSIATGGGGQASGTSPLGAGPSPGTNTNPNNRAFSTWASGNAPAFGVTGSPQSLGTGDPFVSTTTSGFPGNRPINPALRPFPHAYATPETLTQDVQDYELRRALWEYEYEVGNGSSLPYRTNQPYRDVTGSSPDPSPQRPRNT
ncbi:hypothetical protein SLS62_008769 [Diatrype stigma]|uniref:Uncharacterized protein n=1 Tax=Diatrype stigma TaxID=117547 RepID=A0AAN9YK93_9PEZI